MPPRPSSAMMRYRAAIVAPGTNRPSPVVRTKAGVDTATVRVASESGFDGWPQLEQKRLCSVIPDPQETQVATKRSSHAGSGVAAALHPAVNRIRASGGADRDKEIHRPDEPSRFRNR